MITVGLYGIRDTTSRLRTTYTHDHSLAVMRDGHVLSVVEVERWTGRKHDNRLDAVIMDLLAALVPPDEEVRFASVNAFVGDSFVSADGNLRVEPTGEVGIAQILTPARVRFYPDGLRRREARGFVMCHELAHVAALLPFVGRFEPNSLFVHIDGGASDSASSFWAWDGARARLLESSWSRLKAPVNNFNASPLMRAILDLMPEDHLAMPGKLMGYAGHGEASPAIVAWLEDNRFFLDHPGDPADLLDRVNRRFGTSHRAFDAHAPLFKDIAASIQAHFQESITAAILDMQRHTGARHLYFAGGAALNIPTNAGLESSGVFESVHVPPCASDTGLALGAAAWLELGDRGELPRHGPFLGRIGVPCSPVPLTAVREAAAMLAAGAVIGVCNGASEVGPRALGHRSLLARPDSVDLRRRVSEVIKGRAWYRPLAPAVCVEVAREAFGESVAASRLAPFMLGAFRLRHGWGPRFAGVLHHDGSLRAQVVPDDPEHAFLHAVLLELWRAHGVAGLINTSFNGPGEPMVHRHEDAQELARRLGLDAVVIHGSLHRCHEAPS
ncbi:carbamoyltransferase C-terminal domain-containing protein [Sorangium sp. So ce1036]|uniref:carbamoyltransferase C-terminal domain-containing protein n=1 Tax=Sorangium sp. So ce1036 TaxID=3133328 RepID=UPI003F08D29F